MPFPNQHKTSTYPKNMTIQRIDSTLTFLHQELSVYFWRVVSLCTRPPPLVFLLQVARKASTAYYPTLHLELSRYIMLVARSRFEIPWTVSRLIGPPPTAMCKPGKGSARGSPGGQVTPSKRAVANGFVQLPSPQKIEPIKFD